MWRLYQKYNINFKYVYESTTFGTRVAGEAGIGLEIASAGNGGGVRCVSELIQLNTQILHETALRERKAGPYNLQFVRIRPRTLMIPLQ